MGLWGRIEGPMALGPNVARQTGTNGSDLDGSTTGGVRWSGLLRSWWWSCFWRRS